MDCRRPVSKPCLPRNDVRFSLAQKENWPGLAILPPPRPRTKPDLLPSGSESKPEAARSRCEKQRGEATTSTRRPQWRQRRGNARRRRWRRDRLQPYVLLAGDPSLSPSSSPSIPPLGFWILVGVHDGLVLVDIRGAGIRFCASEFSSSFSFFSPWCCL